jgi:hypothetical protein
MNLSNPDNYQQKLSMRFERYKFFRTIDFKMENFKKQEYYKGKKYKKMWNLVSMLEKFN